MPRHEKINYLEFPGSDLDACKEFFSKAFGWVFTDYGPEYTAFSLLKLDWMAVFLNQNLRCLQIRVVH